MISPSRLASGVALMALPLALLITGCGTGLQPTVAPALAPASHIIRGALHGGQQPVAGATVALYVAGTSGYAAPNTNILNRTITSDSVGAFDLSGAYTCTAGQQLYVVGTGGNPGIGANNPALALMAVLGECSTISPDTFLNINEVTTVGAVYALAPFMTGYANLGTSPANVAGLSRAFNSVNKLVDTANGTSPGPALAAGAVAPTAEINTLADIIAGCVNSGGGSAGSSTPCGQLFTQTTVPGGSAPTDTIAAILSIAHFPTNSVSTLYTSPTPSAPFQPQLTKAPADWTISINYTLGGFSAPASATIDAAGQVWVANSGNSTVTVLSQTGTQAMLLSGNGLNVPLAIAIDTNGAAWIANQSGNTVSAFAASGTAIAGSPFTASGTLSGPTSLAFDAPGHLWVTNSASNTLAEIAPDGSLIQTVTVPYTSPSTIAINPK